MRSNQITTYAETYLETAALHFAVCVGNAEREDDAQWRAPKETLRGRGQAILDQPAGGGMHRNSAHNVRKDKTRMSDQKHDHETKATISTLYAEGRIIRGKWSDTDAQGRELLCLYTALVGDGNARPDTCPASLAPAWVAQLMPWWDDAGTEKHWPEVVRRVVAFAPRLGELTGEASTRLDYECRAIALRECLPVAGTSRDIVERVLALCERRAAGDAPSNEEWAAAEAAARAAALAARAAAWAAEEAAARAAAWAALAAAWAAEEWAAAEAAALAALAEAAARAARAALAEAARAAVDRIIDAQLTAIERALEHTQS